MIVFGKSTTAAKHVHTHAYRLPTPMDAEPKCLHHLVLAFIAQVAQCYVASHPLTHTHVCRGMLVAHESDWEWTML